MKRIIKHGGISFLIIKINSLYYLLDGNDIICFINDTHKHSGNYLLDEWIYDWIIMIK